jgi:hypothetical protein
MTDLTSGLRRRRAAGRRKILRVEKRSALRKARSVPSFDAQRNSRRATKHRFMSGSASSFRLILFSFEKSLVNSETPGHTRQLSAGKRRRKNYDSLNLVHCCWVDRGGYREISDARTYDDFLDNRARHHRIDHRRRGYPHVFAPDNRTISSRRPHFFHTRRDPGPLRLHQAEYPFSPRSLIRKEENCSRGR